MPHRIRRDRADTWLLASSPLPTGLVILFFNDRFTSHSWRFAGGIPGGYPAWAGVLLVCGAVMLACLIGDRGARRHGALLTAMTLTGLWWFILGGLFLFTAIVDALANPLGVVAWWTICAFYWIFVHYELRQ